MRKMKYYIRALGITILALISNIGFAETITTNTSINGTRNYSGDVTVRNCTYEINAPVTINGNFIAEGATIIIGENGSLHVTGNFTSETYSHWSLWEGTTTTKSNITINGNLIVDKKLTADDNITVNGLLEANSAKINDNLNIGDNGSMIVYGKLENFGDIVVNGRLESGQIEVEKNLTINSDAILFVNKDESDSNPTGDLTVKKNGKITFKESSISFVEGNLVQDGSTPFGLGLVFPNTGDIDAKNATLIVEGIYDIYETAFGTTDSDCEYIDPTQNPHFYSFKGVTPKNVLKATPKGKSAFEQELGDLERLKNQVLPIELVYFHAHEIGYGVRFEWETASELNNDYFTIEFSIDAVEFAELTKIDGAGTTTEPHNYRYTDFSSHAGIIYYRLKQTDYDGNFSYSETVPVVFAEHHEAETEDIKFVVYPNPATDHITISGGEYESISFVSANGAVLGREAAQGSHDITRLPKGLNFVIIHTANGDVSERFIKR